MKTVSLFITILLFPCFLYGQEKFIVEDGKDVTKMSFAFITPIGYTRISNTDNPNLVSLYGTFDKKKLKPLIKKELINGIQKVRFKIGGENASIDDNKINFSNLNKDVENKWEVYLTKKKPMDLEYTFGFGRADFDLSGGAINNLKIFTEKTDVSLRYMIGTKNQVDLNELNVKSDFGDFSLYRAEAIRAKKIVAQIGAGDVEIEYTEKSETVTNYKIEVEKGDVKIIFPNKNIPVKITINKNPLSDFTCPKGFVERNGVYVNQHYYVNAPNALIFDIDVSWGDVEIVWGGQ